MKQHIRKLIALVLVLCMVVPMAPAAHASGWGLLGWLSGWWNSGREETKETEPPVAETEPAWNNDDPGMMLALVEDQDTVSEDVVMRASVYEADASDPVAQAELEGSNVVYYPSTFFDYDGPTSSPWNGQSGTINQTMANLEVEYALDHGLDLNNLTWMGLYFGMYNRNASRTGSVVTSEPVYSQATGVRYSALAGSNVTNAATSYYYLENGTYYPVTVTRTGSSRNYTYTLYANGKQIWTGTTTSTNNTFSGVTLYTLSTEITATSSSYADWYKWGKDDNDNNGRGDYIHSGMVTGMVDGVPQFQGSYASRLFDGSTQAGKHIYTDVGLPFVYNNETGYYTFDSSERGAYFADGVVESGVNLELMSNPVVVQPYGESTYHTAFMPFNVPGTQSVSSYYDTNGNTVSGTAYRLSGTNNYFFSMITSVPFTMTENGRMIGSDDTSDPIRFEFAGDDDVWVFVDGVLVLDLGGIHGAASGEIDFAANEVTFWASEEGRKGGDATVGGYGEAAAGVKIHQCNIFNDGEIAGKLNTTRSTFAATDNHTLTVVYMERGANLSNCMISFNLPQKDYVAVTKQINENLYKQDNEDEPAGETITDELFETLNQRNFTYILYQDNVPMAGTRFSRYDANGNFVGNGTTASDGTFNVKNGETVRFYDVDFNGVNAYHVAELDPDAGSSNNAWGTATWEHNISTAYGSEADAVDTAAIDNYYVSKTITTMGSTEAVDVIYFTNTNKLLSPVADIADDEFVLDFGLAVELNPLANDTYSATGNTLVLSGISDAAEGTYGTTVDGDFGTLEIVDGKVVYTLDTQFTGADVFYYRVKLDNGEALEDVFGTITIMPATTMYYEENFADLNLEMDVVILESSPDVYAHWNYEGTAQGGYQEEGRVGTTTDSPYGSDKVYMKNAADSYGTSWHADTTNGAATFSYTFTGTGTALYARTSDKSAYMMISVTDVNGNEVFTWNRNTIYKPTEDTQLTDNTLYNIPVFVYQADAYGTYTVSVALTKALKVGGSYYRGCDFYLDGIRVYNPANAYTGESANPKFTMIEDAYARDGEAYITVDSLRNKLLTDNTTYEQVGVDENGDPVYEFAWDGGNYVVFTDSNGEIRDAQTYQSAGPKEEVYMKAGQTVTFSLDNWDQNQNKVFLGIKAPSGSGVVSINGNEIEINNTTDIYFDITKYANVSNNVATFKVEAMSALISVTTIKVTGTADFTIVDGVE